VTTYVMRKGKIVERSKAGPSDAPYVISDEMSATRHMADGKHYTSKKKFRDATRAAGCVELGNDVFTMKDRKPVQLDRRQRVDDIKRAIYQLKNRS
jgi:hypothetical protein